MPPLSEHFERPGILALPTELIHTILLELPPLCIEHFSQTCKLARHHVYGETRIGDLHLWKNLYLQRFDEFPMLFDNHNDDEQEDSSSGASSSSSSSASSSNKATTSIMSLVQLRDRAARLYGGDPSNLGPITLNYNAVLSALLSVIDTAVPAQDLNPCMNSTWLDDSVLSSGQGTWSEWVFPRTTMHSLEDYMLEAAQEAAKTAKPDQGSKRRRITGRRSSGDNARNNDNKEASASNGTAGSSRRRSSSSKSTSSSSERPDSVRRRSARLLKLMYPESLHGLVDEGIDIEELAQPQMRLAARIHCLHGIRAWKDSQKQRLTASPQEISGQRQQDGLANEGAAQASAETASEEQASAATQSGSADQHPRDGSVDQASTSQSGENNEDQRGATAQSAENGNVETEEDGEEDDGDEDEDDDDFDDLPGPPANILRFRPRMFGPSFGFCSLPDEEDQVRARMRHRIYDCGYYGWTNSYAPLHGWRHGRAPQPRRNGHGRWDADDDEEGEEDEDEDEDDVAMADPREHGSIDGDDDAWREATQLSDDDIPDDPVPIEIEVSEAGDERRTFQVADRYGNPIQSEQPAPSTTARGWDSSDDEDDPEDASGGNGDGTDRTLFQPPSLGTYDADTSTYTYEGDLPLGIVTGSRNIEITIGNTIDFVATGVLNVRFIRPGMLAETLRVSSGNVRGAGRLGNIADDENIHQLDDEDVDEDVDEEDEVDDDYDEDADGWDGEEVDELDDMYGPFYDMFRPAGGMAGYRGSHADDEIKDLVEQHKSKQNGDKSDDASAEAEAPKTVSLRPKSVHWELVEAIMVVMYANLKEAIWLENWGVGIRIPKVYDDAGLMVRDPMELREFLEFPTGWVSSFPNPLPSGLKIEDVTHEDTGNKQGSQAESMAPKVSEANTTNSEDDEKPYDWARCESFWAGTYAFLDYSHFVDFNMRLAARRNALKDQTSTDKKAKTSAPGQNSGHRENVLRKPSLVGQEEAVGDCLQLRLELLPKSQQPEYNADEEGQEDDPDYPTLYFRGTTVTYWGNEAPMPRGGVYGKVRPVYAREEDVDEILSKGPRGKKKIEGLHWSVTHSYENEDRWQLEGIQPGPPGTRAPIFGIWSDASHEDESPNGPFVYWMMDERPWKDIDRINRREAHEAAAARAAGNR